MSSENLSPISSSFEKNSESTIDKPELINEVVIGLLAILICALFFATGVALFRILIPIDFAHKELSAGIIGNLVAGNSLGTFITAITCRRLLMRVGHIRLFCAGVAATIAAFLTLVLIKNYWFLGFLLIIIGFSTSLAFFAIESWINQKISNKMRGRVYGVYIMIFYLGLISGQYGVNLINYFASGIMLIPVILLATAILPLSLTKTTPPPHFEATKISLVTMWEYHRLTLIGVVSSSLLLAPLFTIGPVIAQTKNLSLFATSIFLIATSAGALFFQYPVGYISDIYDRRWILLGLMITIFVGAIFLFFAPAQLDYLFPIMFIIGGASSCIHATSANIAYAKLERKYIVSIQGKIMLVYGLFATIGVVLIGWLIEWFGIYGYVGYLLSISINMAVFTLISISKKPKA